MPDIYFSYVNFFGNQTSLAHYHRLIQLFTESDENRNQAMKLIFDTHPEDALPSGAYHEDSSWNLEYLGSKWLNMWLDDGLIIESAWDTPLAFFQHLYAYLWKIDPYAHLDVYFNGNDEGRAHWIYGEQFIERISEMEVAKKLQLHPYDEGFDTKYTKELNQCLDTFQKNMPWREWAGDEILDFLTESFQKAEDNIQIKTLSFHKECIGNKIHWKAIHQSDDNLGFTLIYEKEDDGSLGDFDGYVGLGGEYLENHPQIWRFMRELELPVPKPKILPPPKITLPKVIKQLKEPQDFPNTAQESALKFLEILVEEEYLELTDSKALSSIANTVSEFFEADISKSNEAHQKAVFLIEKLLTQDSVEEIYISDEELASRLLRW